MAFHLRHVLGGITAERVEFDDALEQTATVCGGGFVTECGWTIEVENVEGGEMILNQ